MQTSDRFFVITGGPGSGKTTLIEALKTEGFTSMPEAGRAIIRDQVAIGGNALPWADRQAFAELMLSWELRSWHEAQSCEEQVIFDRGVPDVTGYLELCGLPVPSQARKAADLFRYNATVFIAPPWPEIFAQDAERRQSLAEAEATHETMLRVYSREGYNLVSLPCASVGERVAFVLGHTDPQRLSETRGGRTTPRNHPSV